MRSLGVDLQQQVSLLQARAESLSDRTIDRATSQVRHSATIAGLAIVGSVLALVTLGIGLFALYRYIEMNHGQLAGLGAAGAATAILALLMFTIASSTAKNKVVSPAMAVPAYMPPAMPQSVVGSAPIASTLVPPLPPGAKLADVLSHKVSSHAVAASDQAINAAVDIVRTGSRGALYGTLAVTVLAGLLVGRRKS